MLEIENLCKRYESHPGRSEAPAVDDVSLQVMAGEFFTMLGPSGCGKTTTLRSVAGLETPTSGEISISGRPVFRDGRSVPVHKRDIAMVFQSYAIWPHMTVGQNVAFPLQQEKLAREDRDARVGEALRMVDLERLGERPATALSGGQQQRVAFARAVVRRSKLLLLDEPLSNLDASLRIQMRAELRNIQRSLKTTTIYVTHDQEEALSLSDRIAIMRQGRVLEVGTPEQLYLRPVHAFTATFIGQAQLWPISRTSDPDVVESPFGRLAVDCRDLEGELQLLIRPEHIEVSGASDLDDGRPNTCAGTIRQVVFSGKLTDLEVDTPAGVLRVQELSGVPRKVGDEVHVTMPKERCVAVVAEGAA